MTDSHQDLPVISDTVELLRYGVVKVPLPALPDDKDWQRWAATLSQVTPEIVAGEGDGEYAFYRNILEEPDFPFSAILESDIGAAMIEHFGMDSLEEVELNDAFCVHYDTETQQDTSGARHTDPSDITVNLCLAKSKDCVESHVKFYGTQPLQSKSKYDYTDRPGYNFAVRQDAGYATVHWGAHCHETMAMKRGQRTNIVLTYWYKDPKRCQALKRTCYS